jgi:peptidoglycan hydrolase-like protein with peptidoglycan-binding domain
MDSTFKTLKKSASALLAAVLLICSAGHALAAPGTGDILINIGDENDNVILLQLRLKDLGYYNYKITGYFGDFTSDALKAFQKANPPLSSDGKAGAQTLKKMYSNEAKRKPVSPIAKPKPTKTTSATKKTSTRYGKLVDWSTVNRLWKNGTNCKVIDFDTRTTYTVKRVNGSYSVGHADVAPISKADTNVLKKTFGGEYNAYRRALVVNIGGQWIAASLYGEPHGSTGVPGNGMNKEDGTLQQVCIHFLNSWTNECKAVDPAHQYQIKRAAHIKPTGSRPVLVYPGD